MNRFFAIVSVAAAFALPAYAEDAHHTSGAGARLAQASESLSEGEVRKVDKEAKKITIKHGPLANLDMPPMTMVFQVKDPALLEQARAGDKVKFRAEKVGGAYLVTEIQTAR